MKPNMSMLLAQAQKMQSDMGRVQKDLDNSEVEGIAANGAVKVVMSATGNIKSVLIDPSVIDPEEHELLEDLILTAFKDAKSKADEMSKNAMSAVTGGLSIPGLF